MATLHWNVKEDRLDDKGVTHAVLKTIAAFLNTEGGDLLIGVADDGSIVGIERDRLESDDKFMRHLAQVVRNGLGARAGTCIDPKTQVVQAMTVCVVSCQRSPEPVFLKFKGMVQQPKCGGGNPFAALPWWLPFRPYERQKPDPVNVKSHQPSRGYPRLESSSVGDFFVRTGPGTVKLPTESANEYIRTRFDRASEIADGPSTGGAR